MSQPVQQQPTQIVFINTTPNVYVANRVETLAAKQMITLGALQIVIGILCIAFQIAALCLLGSAIAPGIWCGVTFIVAGSVGISAGRNRYTSYIIGTMVMSIISAVMTIVLLAISAAIITIITVIKSIRCTTTSYNYNLYRNHDYPYQTEIDCPEQYIASALAMNAILIALAILEAIVAIWQSALCCAARACSSGNNGTVQGTTTQYTYTVPGEQPNVQFVTVPVQGQQVSYPAQVVSPPGYIQPGYPAPAYSAQQTDISSAPVYYEK